MIFIQYIVCPNFKYGNNCSNDCACKFNNTKICDHVTGECECSVGWTGTDCSEDIDECKSGSISCNESIFQVCVNTKGSAHCECQYGGSDISNCVRKLNDKSVVLNINLHLKEICVYIYVLWFRFLKMFLMNSLW